MPSFHGYAFAGLQRDATGRYLIVAYTIAKTFLALKIVIFIGLLVITTMLAASISAQQQRIAAIVNDDVISRQDVENRLDFVVGISSLANTREVRQNLLSYVIQSLIDEHIKVQYARNIQLEVSDTEILDAIRVLEKQNGLSPGDFANLIEHRHLDRTTAINRVRSEVAWYKVIQHTMRSQVRVGEDEINAVLHSLRVEADLPQSLLSEIFLPVDDLTREEGTRILAERLVEQLRTGADFKATARQFSQTTSAATGGDLGWVVQGQLASEAEKVLVHMQPGELSIPIRTQSGYVILLLRERHYGNQETLFTMSQLLIPTSGPNAIPQQTRSALVEAAKSTSSCEGFNALAKKTQTSQSGSLGRIRAGDLPPALRATVLQLKPRTASAPIFIANNDIVVLMVCERISSSVLDIPSREEIIHRLEIEKVSLIQDRKLRNLRRAAFIEIRL